MINGCVPKQDIAVVQKLDMSITLGVHWCCPITRSCSCCCVQTQTLVLLLLKLNIVLLCNVWHPCCSQDITVATKTQYIYGVHISTCLLFRYIALSMPLNKLEIAAVQNTTLLLPKLNTNHAKSASVRNHLGCSSTQRTMSWTTLLLMCAISQWKTMSCGSRSLKATTSRSLWRMNLKSPLIGMCPLTCPW